MQRQRVVFIGVLALLCAGHAALVLGAETDFRLRIRGFAEGAGFAAHREALIDAQQEAMREILRVKVASGDLRPYRSMIRKAEHYVTRVEELQSETAGGETRVEVDAYLDMTALEQDLAALALPRLPEAPTLSCLVAVEENGAIEVGDPCFVEEKLVEGLKKLGLAPSPHTALNDLFKVSDYHDAALGDVAAASKYARETLADVTLIGLVTVERREGVQEGAPGRTRANLTVKVFRGRDGDLLDAFSRSAAITGLDPDQCREEAVGDAVTKIIGDVTVATVLSVLGQQHEEEVLITLQNPGSRTRVTAFLEAFQQEPMIDYIEESYFSTTVARIRLGYQGNLGYLVDQVRDRSYEGWPLEIREVVGREMNLVFLKPQG